MLIGFVMTRSVRKTAIMVVLLAAAAAAMLYAGSFSREAAEVYAAALTEPHATASATAVNMKEGSWVYSSYADSDGQVYASVTGYDGNALTLDIPGTLGGLTVRAIGREAFCGSRYLTAVTIPEGVTEIGKYAFQGCVGLQNVTVPSTLRNIGEGAFYGCFSLTEMQLSDSVTRIGSYAFSGCRHLAKVRLSASLRSIGDNAFDKCTLLENVTFGEELEQVGNAAFRGCAAMTSVKLPDRLQTLGAGAFQGCTALTDVSLGNGLEILENDTFRRCEALESVSLSGITSVGASAFEGCTSLTEAEMNQAVSVGGLAFHGCTALRKLAFGEALGSVGLCAFEGCGSLSTLSVDENNTVFCVKKGALYSKDGEELVCCPQGVSGTLRISEGTRRIRDFALHGCDSLSGVSIPDSVEKIGTAAFMNCTDITELYLPVKTAKLGSLPFGCYFRGGQLKREPYLRVYGTAGDTSELYCAAREIPFVAYHHTLLLSSERIVLAAGKQFTLKSSFVGNKKASLVWESSDPSVAAVSKGRITALSEGTAEITASAEGFDPVSVSVRVTGAEELSASAKKTYDKRQMYVGEAEELSSIVNQVLDPLLASDKYWYTSDPSVATVSSDGQVTAVKNGTVGITCCLPDGSENIFYMTVCQRPSELTLTVPDEEMSVGQSMQADVMTLPKKTRDKITWKSENPNIIAVDEQGRLTGLSQGSCEITAESASGLKSAVTVRCVLPAEKLSLRQEKREVYQGKEFTLEAVLSPAQSRQSVMWRSSDPTVVSVNSKGKVKGVSFGSAVVYASTADGLTAQCEVTVVTRAELLHLDVKKLLLNRGDTHRLNAVIYPSYSPETTDKCLWSSTNEAVASVDENGVVTAVGVGSCIINCKTSGDLISKCQVSVRQPAQSAEITGGKSEIYIGEVTVLNVRLTPDDTTDKVEWHTDNEEVVYVSDNGSVKGKAAGSAVVTAKVVNDVTGEAVTASYEIIVMKKADGVKLRKSSLSLTPGATDALMYSLTPSDCNDTVRWYSTDEKVAVVRSDGLITAVGEGTCSIVVETGSGCSARCKVTVSGANL